MRNAIGTFIVIIPLAVWTAGASGSAGEPAEVPDLTKRGKAEATALVSALRDAGNNARARAAEGLRALLAADPDAAPSYHHRAFWEARIARTTAGMRVDEAVRVLLPEASAEQRKAAMQMGAWSGRSGFSVCRLDDYWTATLHLVDADDEKLSQPPTLNRSVRYVWVEPPAGYTGPWVTWFVNGHKAHEIAYRNGRYDGVFTSFHDDGSPSVEQHYRDGVCDGPDTGWNRDGRKVYEGRYNADRQDGLWQHWYPDGKPQCVRQYRDGKLDGLCAAWFANGLKQHEQHYRDGLQHGLDTCWDEQGKVLWVRMYRDGQLVEAR